MALQSALMEIDFQDDDLRRLATDPAFDMGLDRGVVKAYRMAIQAICAAVDERIFAVRPGWRYEKLKGDLRGKYSIRLNGQWRLLMNFRTGERGKIVVVISVVDYH
jgi:proteic killer suppression protein